MAQPSNVMQNVQKVLSIWSKPTLKQCSAQTNLWMCVHLQAHMVKYMSVDSPSSATGQKSHGIYLVVKLRCGKMEWVCVARF